MPLPAALAARLAKRGIIHGDEVKKGNSALTNIYLNLIINMVLSPNANVSKL